MTEARMALKVRAHMQMHAHQNVTVLPSGVAQKELQKLREEMSNLKNDMIEIEGRGERRKVTVGHLLEKALEDWSVRNECELCVMHTNVDSN